MFINFIRIFFLLPEFFCYIVYDFFIYIFLGLNRKFFGWGIHLITGEFGAGKSSDVIKSVFEITHKYDYLTILTNLPINKDEFDGINIIDLKCVDDIINAPHGCLCVIDEIGTIFNSRDFSTSKNKRTVPKSLFQHLCQCRKRNLVIYGTVQRYNLLDKQIRDISADVSVLHSYFKHPFTRLISFYKYDINDYDYHSQNAGYVPVPISSGAYVQKNLYRNLYNTTDVVDSMLEKEYISDKEILENRAINTSYQTVDRKQRQQIRRNIKR